MSVWVTPPNKLITPHFHYAEAVCRHCGKVPTLEVVQNTARWLERVRSEVFNDRICHINSWCRCPVHNAAVGGAEHSLHMRGWATDLTVRGLSPTAVWKLARAHQGEGELIGGLGKYVSFTHIDRGPARRWTGP